MSDMNDCDRAYRRWVKTSVTEAAAMWLPCKSRTCDICKPVLDRVDTERIAAGIGRVAYIARIPQSRWPSIAHRLRRHGARAARIPIDSGTIVVIATEPPIANAGIIPDVVGALLPLLESRPTGHDHHLTTVGDMPTRREWLGWGTAEALNEPQLWWQYARAQKDTHGSVVTLAQVEAAIARMEEE